MCVCVSMSLHQSDKSSLPEKKLARGSVQSLRRWDFVSPLMQLLAPRTVKTVLLSIKSHRRVSLWVCVCVFAWACACVSKRFSLSAHACQFFFFLWVVNNKQSIRFMLFVCPAVCLSSLPSCVWPAFYPFIAPPPWLRSTTPPSLSLSLSHQAG